MKYQNALRGVLLATVMVPMFSQSVLAQVAARVDAPPAVATAPSPAPQGDKDFVVLGDFTPVCDKPVGKHSRADWQDHCAYPRAATQYNVADDSPAVSHAAFLHRYPNAGEAGYQRIAGANKELCQDGIDYLTGLNTLDQLFQKSDSEYQILSEIYNDLPSEVKSHTRIMQVTQVAQAGLLCLLSAGLYCIAAAVGAGGNIVSAEANLDLQLDNVKLSIANIVVTRLNIWSNQLTLRLDGLWLKRFMPFCHFMGYDTPSGLRPLSPIPAVPDGFGQKTDD